MTMVVIEHGKYSMVTMRRLLEVRRLLEGDVYFNVDTKRCSTY